MTADYHELAWSVNLEDWSPANNLLCDKSQTSANGQNADKNL